MIRIFEPNYGADSDDLRGIAMTFYELEPSDTPEIIRQLKEEIESGNEDDVIVVSLECQETGDMIDFDIEKKDYL